MASFQEYFEQIAREHPLLRHSKTQPHFYRFGLEEILAGIKTANYPYLSIDKPEFKLKKSPGQRTKRRTLAISVVNKYAAEDFTSKGKVTDALDTLLDEIIIRIKHDVENGIGPFIELDFDSISCVDLPTDVVNKTTGKYMVFDAVEAFDDTFNSKTWINGN